MSPVVSHFSTSGLSHHCSLLIMNRDGLTRSATSGFFYVNLFSDSWVKQILHKVWCENQTSSTLLVSVYFFSSALDCNIYFLIQFSSDCSFSGSPVNFTAWVGPHEEQLLCSQIFQIWSPSSENVQKSANCTRSGTFHRWWSVRGSVFLHFQRINVSCYWSDNF